MSGGMDPQSQSGGGGPCTVAGLLESARQLADRLDQHDSNAQSILSETEQLEKYISSMKTYQQEVESLNENNRYRAPRSQLLRGMHLESRQITQLQKENQELRVALEEHQGGMELMMSRYRQQVHALTSQAPLDLSQLTSPYQVELELKNAKILEMVAVMQQVVRLDETSAFAAENKIAQLEMENKTLRELLIVTKQFHSTVKMHPASRKSSSDEMTQSTENCASVKNENLSPEPFCEEYPSNTVNKKRTSSGDINANITDNAQQVVSNGFGGSSALGEMCANLPLDGADKSSDLLHTMPLTNGDTTEYTLSSGIKNSSSSNSGNVEDSLSDKENQWSGSASVTCDLDGSGSGVTGANGSAGTGVEYQYPTRHSRPDSEAFSDTESDCSSNASTVTLTGLESDNEEGGPPELPAHAHAHAHSQFNNGSCNGILSGGPSPLPHSEITTPELSEGLSN